MELESYVRGKFKLDHGTTTLIPTMHLNQFGHAGIVTITPTFGMDLLMNSDLDMDGNYTSYFQAFTPDNIIRAWPASAQDMSASVGVNSRQLLSRWSSYDGNINKINGKGSFRIDLIPKFGVDINLQKFGTDTTQLHAVLDASLDAYSSFKAPDQDGQFLISMGSSPASTELNYLNSNIKFAQWKDDDQKSQNIGLGDAKNIHEGKEGEAPTPGSQLSKTVIKTNEKAAFGNTKSLVCTKTEKKTCKDVDYNCGFDLCEHHGLCIDRDSLAGWSDDYVKPGDDAEDRDDQDANKRHLDQPDPSDQIEYSWDIGSGFNVTDRATAHQQRTHRRQNTNKRPAGLDDLPDGVPPDPKDDRAPKKLKPEDDEAGYIVSFSDGRTLNIEARDYPPYGKLWNTRKSLREVPKQWFDFEDENDCSNTKVGILTAPRPYPDPENHRTKIGTQLWPYATEHITELQTLQRFIYAMAEGKLMKSTTKMTTPKIPASTFIDNWNKEFPMIQTWPPVVSSFKKKFLTPNDRIYESLGSWGFRKNFVACGREINSIKARIWMNASPRAYLNFKNDVNNWLDNCDDPVHFLKYLKGVITTYHYLHHKEINTRMKNQHQLIQTQLGLIEKNIKGFDNLQKGWNEFMV